VSSLPLEPTRPLLDRGAIRRRLGAGKLVDDGVFDGLFPPDIRRASAVHWTPVEVALRAAKLLASKPGAVVLDVGAGVGKFCLVAACAIDAHVRGVEHRAHFVSVARDAAAEIGVEVDMIHGTIDQLEPADVDGVYLFNPFAENLCPSSDRLDSTVELNEARFWRDLGTTTAFLDEARPGTRVVTYCGIGGTLPRSYALATRERRFGTLELWIRR
jgi:hypothetical protein